MPKTIIYRDAANDISVRIGGKMRVPCRVNVKTVRLITSAHDGFKMVHSTSRHLNPGCEAHCIKEAERGLMVWSAHDTRPVNARLSGSIKLASTTLRTKTGVRRPWDTRHGARLIIAIGQCAERSIVRGNRQRNEIRSGQSCRNFIQAIVKDRMALLNQGGVSRNG